MASSGVIRFYQQYMKPVLLLDHVKAAAKNKGAAAKVVELVKKCSLGEDVEK
jgi:hypothetical protein